MKSTLRLISVALLMGLPWSSATVAGCAPFDLLKDMSVADFRATGLDKLSDAQIKALNAWLTNYQNQHAKDCAQSATIAPATVTAAAAISEQHKVDGNIVTTSRISGKFNGWYGSTVFKLQNGQTWEQTDDSVMTIAAMQDPEVTISKGTFDVYYLQVKGLADSVPVRKVDSKVSN